MMIFITVLFLSFCCGHLYGLKSPVTRAYWVRVQSNAPQLRLVTMNSSPVSRSTLYQSDPQSTSDSKPSSDLPDPAKGPVSADTEEKGSGLDGIVSSFAKLSQSALNVFLYLALAKIAYNWITDAANFIQSQTAP